MRIAWASVRRYLTPKLARNLHESRRLEISDRGRSCRISSINSLGNRSMKGLGGSDMMVVFREEIGSLDVEQMKGSNLNVWLTI